MTHRARNGSDDEQETNIAIVIVELRINKFRRPDYWIPSLVAMASLLKIVNGRSYGLC